MPKTKRKAAPEEEEEEEASQSTQGCSQDEAITTDESQLTETQDSVLLDHDIQQDQSQQEIQGEYEEDEDNQDEKEGQEKGGTRKKKKAAKKKVIETCTERDAVERVPLPRPAAAATATAADDVASSSKTFTVLAWNVNGIRATVKNGLDVLKKMVETERPDLVCFQVRTINCTMAVQIVAK